MAEGFAEASVAWLASAWRENLAEAEPTTYQPTSQELADLEVRAGLPVGVLTSVADYLWLCERDDPARAPTWVTGPQSSSRQGLLDACASTSATSLQWSQLAWVLVADPSNPPTPAQAQALADSLIRDLPRGIKHCYRHHRIASLLLVTVPVMAAPLVNGIRGCIDNPEGPAFLEPIGMLAQIPLQEARDLVLDLLERPRTPNERRYAGWLATQLMQRGDFDEAQRSRLTVVLMTHWRSDPHSVAEELAELVEELPDGVRRMFARAQGHTAPQGSLPLSDVVGERAERLVATLLAAVDASQVMATGAVRGQLAGLLEQALCRANSEDRHRAAQVLSASPYRAALADGLLALLAADGADPLVRRRAAAVVSSLLDESHRLPLLSLLDDPQSDVVALLLSALGHVSPSPISDQELRQRLSRQHLPFGRPCMYALGMSGSAVLPGLAASRTAPAWQRAAAAHWLQVGPAIRV